MLDKKCFSIKIVAFVFVMLPFFWAGFLTFQIYQRGDAGFCYELGSNSFKVMRIYRSLNPVREGDDIKFIDDYSTNDILGFYISHVKKAPFKGFVTIERQGRWLSFILSYENLSWRSYLKISWPFILLALLLTASGFIAFTRASPDQPSGLFLACYIIFAINIINEIGLNFGIQPLYFISLVFIVATLSNWLGFSLWTHFLLRFPTEQPLFENNQPIITAVYLLPPIVSVLAAFCLAGSELSFFCWLQRTRFWHILPIIGFTAYRNWTTFMRTKDPYVKNQLKWIILGGYIGITPYLFFYLVPHLFFGYPLITFKTSIAFGALIPISFLLAILRYRLMDIDEIISTGLSYTILLTGLFLSYAGILVVLKKSLWGNKILTEGSFIAYLVIVAILFDPTKNRIKLIIDRAFFKDKLNYRNLLHHYSQKVATTLKLSDLIDLLIKKIPSDFRISRACVMILEGRRSRLYPQHLRFGNAPWSGSSLLKVLNDEKTNCVICEPERTNDFRLAKEMEEILRAGYLLVFPLKGTKSFLGMYFLGPKLGENLYTSADIQVLTTLALHVSFAMENALMYESLQKSKQQLQKVYFQLLQSEQMAHIGEMASIVAHEIRNPLGIIRSSAQYLAEDLKLNESAKEVLDFIIEEADRLNQVVNNLLDLARFKPPTFSEVYIDELITQILNKWERSGKHNPSVIITQTGSPGRRPIYADEKQLRQVFLNLVQNSEEAMPNGGKLNIDFSEDRKNDGIIISISDTGTGIPEDVTQKVFKKFFTTKDKGLGLGLAVCQQIIEAHNGSISIKSTPGEGTTVSVWLPRKPHSAVGGLL